MTWKKTAGAAAMVVALLASLPVRALNLKESDKWTLDLDGAAKAYGIGVYLPWPWPALASPASMGGLGWNSRSAALGLGDLRLKFHGAYKDRVRWKVHLRTAVMLSTQPGVLDSMGGGVSALAEPPRWLPLQFTDTDDPNVLWKGELDRLMVKVRFWKIDLTVGRQPISFGVGFVFQPMDLVGTFSPLEIDKEFKPGVDAVRADIALGKFTELTLVGVFGGPVCRHTSVPSSTNPLAPSKWTTPSGGGCSPGGARLDPEHSSAAVRLRTTWGKFDLGGLVGWVRGDVVAGLFASGAIKRFKLRAEGTFTHHFTSDELKYFFDDGELQNVYWTPVNNYFRAVVGFDYTFDTKKHLSTLVEFYYNGFGTLDKNAYLYRAMLPRVSEFGEVVNFGMFYLAWGWTYEAADKLKLIFSTMANLRDPSAHFSLMLDFTLSDNASVVMGGFVPVGKKIKLIYQSGLPTGEFKIGSEFGLYPYMFFAQYKRYF